MAYPKPKDIIKISLNTGVELVWEVTAVFLGGETEESVTQLRPVTQSQNAYGATLIPSQLLDCLLRTKGGALYSYDPSGGE